MGNNISVSGHGQPDSLAAEAVSVSSDTSTSKIPTPRRSVRPLAASATSAAQASPVSRGPLQQSVPPSPLATRRANVRAAVPIPDAAVRMIQPPTSTIPPDACRTHRIVVFTVMRYGYPGALLRGTEHDLEREEQLILRLRDDLTMPQLALPTRLEVRTPA